jgi:hypothetical protein
VTIHSHSATLGITLLSDEEKSYTGYNPRRSDRAVYQFAWQCLVMPTEVETSLERSRAAGIRLQTFSLVEAHHSPKGKIVN